jgi:hypothetical protein
MFKKIKNYFKGLFVDKRQETLLKTIQVWDEAKNLPEMEVIDLIPEPGFSEAHLTTEDTKIVGEWAAPRKPRKPRAKKAKVEDTTTEKVNEVKPKKRNYKKRKPKADKAD